MSSQFETNSLGLVVSCTATYQNVLKWKYGITADDYNKLLASQGLACAICKRAPGKRMLEIDHNHQTNEIRGLLCKSCNLKLYGVDEKEWLETALKYLEKPPATGLIKQVYPPKRNH